MTGCLHHTHTVRPHEAHERKHAEVSTLSVCRSRVVCGLVSAVVSFANTPADDWKHYGHMHDVECCSSRVGWTHSRMPSLLPEVCEHFDRFEPCFLNRSRRSINRTNTSPNPFSILADFRSHRPTLLPHPPCNARGSAGICLQLIHGLCLQAVYAQDKRALQNKHKCHRNTHAVRHQ